MKKRLPKFLMIVSTIVLIYCLVLYLMDTYPLGNYSIAIVDFKTQYLPFFTYYRENFLANPIEFMYSSSMSLGDSLNGLYSYYLASPLNLILYLFPLKNVELGVFTVIMTKFVLMGITSSLLLEKFKLSTTMNYLLSVSYALSGYAIVNIANPMWLDAVYLLPLMFIAIDKIIRGKSFIPFILVYSTMILANFYISFMIGITSIIYFIYSYLLIKEKFIFKEFLITSGKFALSAVLSAGVTISLLVPTILKLGSSKNESDIKFTGVFENPIDLFSKFYIGSNGGTQLIDGMPNVYLPSMFISLLVLFFFIKTISKREKIITGVFIAVNFMVMYLPFFSYLLHGLNNPIWFQYRYSFVMILFMMLIGARVIENITEISLNKKLVFAISAVYIGLMFYFLKGDLDYVVPLNIVASTVYLLITLIIIYQIPRSKNRKLFNANNLLFILTLVTLLEISHNMVFTNLNVFSFAARTDSNEEMTYVDKIKDVYSKIEDSESYRTETNFKYSYNDNLLTGLKGVSGFNSTMTSDTIKFLAGMGYLSNGQASNSSEYTGGTLFSDSLLNIKYVIAPKDLSFENQYLDSRISDYSKNSFIENHNSHINAYISEFDETIDVDSDLAIYKNNSVLGYGWLQDNLTDIMFTKNPFENMNNVYSSILDSKDKLYTEKEYKLKLNNLSYNKKDKLYTVVDENKAATLTLIFDNEKDKDIYSNSAVYSNVDEVVIPNLNARISISFNGKNLASAYGAMISPLLLENSKDKDNTLQFEVTPKHKIHNFKFEEVLYESDTEKLKEDLKSKQGRFTIEQFTSTLVKGTVEADKDSHLVTTIPYSENWTVKVNGKSVGKEKAYNTFISVPVKKGNNVIEFVYAQPKTHVFAFVVVTIISIGTALVLDNKFKKE